MYKDRFHLSWCQHTTTNVTDDSKLGANIFFFFDMKHQSNFQYHLLSIQTNTITFVEKFSSVCHVTSTHTVFRAFFVVHKTCCILYAFSFRSALTQNCRYYDTRRTCRLSSTTTSTQNDKMNDSALCSYFSEKSIFFFSFYEEVLYIPTGDWPKCVHFGTIFNIWVVGIIARTRCWGLVNYSSVVACHVYVARQKNPQYEQCNKMENVILSVKLIHTHTKSFYQTKYLPIRRTPRSMTH